MRNDSDVILLTPTGHTRLTEELDELTTKRRQQIAERIRESMEHGEFSEDNSELEEVKFEQAIVESRIAELRAILGNCMVLSPKDISVREVAIGSRVTLLNTRSKKESVVTVVSTAEADPDRDKISNESPLGMAIFGRAKEDKVTFQAPSGKVTYQIIKIGKAVR
ncbi:MAG: transcription elongation factor GreA [Armatimonadetes bacterium]|nr:transcription elongation factor GreA [Armatimonadota bacterium]